jgi:hypothetical protein
MKKAVKKINPKKLFKPKINYYEVGYFLQGTEVKINNACLYKLVKKLAGSAYPSQEDKFDKRWHYFYLPLKRDGRLISIPLALMEYEKKFYAYLHGFGSICIGRGRQKTENTYKRILSETIRFNRLVRKTSGTIVRKTLPYDFRTGKMRGKYIMKRTMPKKEKNQILAEYGGHLEKGLKCSEISLKEYLDTASICYGGAYGKEAKPLPSIEMYKKWADGRDGGMLSIKNKNSRKEFMQWLDGHAWIGAHPFEIVFSWINHGIHLYPCDREQPYFLLGVTNYAFAEDFIKMARALIKENIPFKALEIEKVLEYLEGESLFTVNEYDEHFFSYIPSKEHKKLYFKNIEWGNIEILKWK